MTPPPHLRQTARLQILLSMLCMAVIAPATPLAGPPAARYLARARARGLAPDGRLIVVSVPDQKLALLAPSLPPRIYAVSTSKWGVGARQDSRQTPLGWHRITDWIGAQARPGQAFVAREPTSEVLPPERWRSTLLTDYVLTRILWLDGLEAGINRGADIDSRSRFIYLHGTNQEHLLGQRASHGCIRLANRDVMELFDQTVNRQTYCWIIQAPLALE
jgi:hypothetical protein